MTNFDEFLNEQMKDPEFKQESCRKKGMLIRQEGKPLLENTISNSSPIRGCCTMKQENF